MFFIIYPSDNSLTERFTFKNNNKIHYIIEHFLVHIWKQCDRWDVFLRIPTSARAVRLGAHRAGHRWRDTHSRLLDVSARVVICTLAHFSLLNCYSIGIFILTFLVFIFVCSFHCVCVCVCWQQKYLLKKIYKVMK